MRQGIHLPLFGPLADPHAVTDIARAAEEAGFDGVFVWDHLLSPVPGQWDIADPWITLAAIATATARVRIGPLVTPLPRRRVAKVARETVTLDRLSGGRLTLGVGTGRDIAREFSAFGEDGDQHTLGRELTETTEVLTALWSGQIVDHHGAITVEGVRMTPGPLQRPRIPLWSGTNRTGGDPIRRAARYDGLFPLGMDTDGVARIAEQIATIRGDLTGFDIAVAPRWDTDLDRCRRIGATWVVHEFWPGDDVDKVLRFIDKHALG